MLKYSKLCLSNWNRTFGHFFLNVQKEILHKGQEKSNGTESDGKHTHYDYSDLQKPAVFTWRKIYIIVNSQSAVYANSVTF